MSNNIQQAWLSESDPPLLNTPFDAEVVRALSIQNVIFQWTPRHLSSPNAPLLVDYELTLVQLIPSTRNPNDAILTSNPIFKEVVNSTSYVYGISEPSLILGETYAWRVRVKDKNGLDIFKNRGYSAVATFKYGDACFLPTNVSAQLLSPTRVKINYTPGSGNNRFVVRFREQKSDNSGVWFEETSPLNYCNLNDLKPNTSYEYEVLSFCGSLSPLGLLPLETFKTANFSADDFACGRVPAAFSLANQSPKMVLERGDIIKATEFEIEVGRVSGGNGIFSGEGIVVLPFMNNLKVNAVFMNIKINADNKMIDGKIALTGATAQALTDDQMADVNAAMTEIEGALNAVESTLDEIDTILDKIDMITGKMYDYLPEDLQLNLSTARDSLSAARSELKNLPSDATAEQKAAAKDKVRRAKQEVRTALLAGVQYYAQALVKFARILWLTVQELGTEATQSKAAKQAAMKTAEDEVFMSVYGVVPPAPPTIPIVEKNFVFFNEIAGEIETPSNYPSLTTPTEKGVIYKNKALDLALTEVIKAVILLYAAETDMKQFGEDMKELGLDAVDFIMRGLQQRKSEALIISETKIQIKQKLIEIIGN